jgi:hypothetical protein
MCLDITCIHTYVRKVLLLKRLSDYGIQTLHARKEFTSSSKSNYICDVVTSSSLDDEQGFSVENSALLTLSFFLPPIVTILSEVSQYFTIKEKKRATYFSHMTIKENQCQ